MGVNRFKHFHRGNVYDNGYCKGNTFSYNGVSFDDFVVTQYYSIVLEEFSVKSVDGVVILPFSKTSTDQCSWDHDIGAYYTLDKLVSLIFEMARSFK